MKNIANIINFVRACEPRVKDDSFLFETTKKELELCARYGFKSTVLFQYDALIDSRYTDLVNKHKELVEVGLWFEVVEPLCRDCGIEWHGRFPWDWHNDVGFLIGYMPEQRRVLIDKAFEKFREIFGYYPAVAGSWHIDAFSLRYMKEKYNIIASCNCKEQCLTDGYTMWGGIYNGAYYPSKLNMLCPAQTKGNQIDVPVFRMLGADPIHQYDLGLGNPDKAQHVISLEPVYGNAGADPDWVRWYLKENFNEKNLGFSYTQLGQENSFGWDSISKGLPMQFEQLNEKIKCGEIELLTLGEAGKRYAGKFGTTPVQSICIDSDYSVENYKTLWYYSRFYRANTLYQNGMLWIRDLYIFNERFAEKFLTEREATHNCEYFNLPVMDGFMFSREQKRAGIYFCKNGEKISLEGEYSSRKTDKNSAEISVGNKIKITFTEDRISVKCDDGFTMNFECAECELPYRKAKGRKLNMSFRNFEYTLNLEKGLFCQNGGTLSIVPENREIVIRF